MAKQETNFNWREFKGTKGPWKFRPDVAEESFYIETEDDDRFDSFIGDIGGVLQLKNEIQANAKLIAAAPQMHQLLNEFICQGMKDKPNQESVFEITAKAQRLLIDIND